MRKGLWEVPACGPEIMGGVKKKHRENLSQSFSKLLPLQETSEDICFIFSFYSVEFP